MVKSIPFVSIAKGAGQVDPLAGHHKGQGDRSRYQEIEWHHRTDFGHSSVSGWGGFHILPQTFFFPPSLSRSTFLVLLLLPHLTLFAPNIAPKYTYFTATLRLSPISPFLVSFHSHSFSSTPVAILTFWTWWSPTAEQSCLSVPLAPGRPSTSKTNYSTESTRKSSNHSWV